MIPKTLLIENVIEAILELLALRNEEQVDHASRVAKYSVQMGEVLQLTEEQLEELAVVGKLHDIGKAGVLGAVLSKAATLSRGEWAMMKMHPIFSEEICKRLGLPESVTLPVRQHHESFNGTGYPDKLKGEEIHLYARIVKITDVFDALTSKRPYREALSVRGAIDFMWRISSNFDPVLLDLFDHLF